MVSEELGPELSELLNTFWTATPIWPKSASAQTTPEDASGAGPSRQTRPTPSEDHQLLSLHRLLEAVDPKEAGRWHWRDGRKVKRGLERWWERGGREVPQHEDSDPVAGRPGRRARFRTLIFWVYEPMDTLQPRLDKRVDKMLAVGLSLVKKVYAR
jgi:tRNA dimethylallyltransferase